VGICLHAVLERQLLVNEIRHHPPDRRPYRLTAARLDHVWPDARRERGLPPGGFRDVAGSQADTWPNRKMPISSALGGEITCLSATWVHRPHHVCRGLGLAAFHPARVMRPAAPWPTLAWCCGLHRDWGDEVSRRL